MLSYVEINIAGLELFFEEVTMPEIVTVGRRSPLAAAMAWILSLLGREPASWPPRQQRLG